MDAKARCKRKAIGKTIQQARRNDDAVFSDNPVKLTVKRRATIDSIIEEADDYGLHQLSHGVLSHVDAFHHDVAKPQREQTRQWFLDIQGLHAKSGIFPHRREPVVRLSTGPRVEHDSRDP